WYSRPSSSARNAPYVTPRTQNFLSPMYKNFPRARGRRSSAVTEDGAAPCASARRNSADRLENMECVLRFSDRGQDVDACPESSCSLGARPAKIPSALSQLACQGRRTTHGGASAASSDGYVFRERDPGRAR